MNRPRTPLAHANLPACAAFLFLALLTVGVTTPHAAAANAGPPNPPQRLQAAAPTDGDAYGLAVASAGGFLAVGSPGNFFAEAGVAGAVDLYRRGGDGAGAGPSWAFHQRLPGPAGGPDRGFGLDLAMEGDLLLVGNFNRYDFRTHPRFTARIFQRGAGPGGGDDWGEVAVLTAPPHPTLEVASGPARVALSGDTAAVALASHDAVYVFRRAAGGGSWPLQQRIDGVGPDILWFGSDVALDGDTLAVGAFRDSGRGIDAGAVHVFRRTLPGGRFNFTEKLSPSGSAGFQLGFQVALSGDNLAAGAPGYRGPGGVTAGAVFVYRRTGDSAPWGAPDILWGEDTETGLYYGSAIHLAGDDLTVGNPTADPGGANDAGEVLLYRPADEGRGWALTCRLTAADPAADESLGQAVWSGAEGVFGGAAPLLGGIPGTAFAFAPPPPAGETYNAWAARVFPGNAFPTRTLPGASYLPGGPPNALAYALGLDPLAAGAPGAGAGSRATHPLEILPGGTVRYSVAAAATGANVAVETAVTLDETAVWDALEAQDAGAEGDLVHFEASADPGAAARFFRLRVWLVSP